MVLYALIQFWPLMTYAMEYMSFNQALEVIFNEAIVFINRIQFSKHPEALWMENGHWGNVVS